MKTMKLMLIIAVSAIILTATMPLFADWDAARDFSSTSNSYSPWYGSWTYNSYHPDENGYNTVLMAQDLSVFGVTGFEGWVHSNDAPPAIWKNTSGSAISYNGNLYDAGKLFLQANRYADGTPFGDYRPYGGTVMVRWVAPETGTYVFNASFTGIGTSAYPVSCAIIKNSGWCINRTSTDVSYFNQDVTAKDNVATYNATLVNVEMGAIFDFIALNDYDPGSKAAIQLDANIRNINEQVVPEPASLVALLSGLVGIGGLAIRKRK